MASTTSYRLPRTVIPERYELELVPDLAAGTFRGTVTVHARVAEATATVALHAAELEIHRAEVTRPDGTTAAGAVSLDPAEQRAAVDFDELLEPGEGHALTLEFTGVLNDKLHGFYRSTFMGEDGAEVVIATTQFEPADARRAFPCFDEPDFKATFAITLIIDDGLTAISNGPVVADVPAGDGKRRVTFAETMIMSTYLVAFVVGPFELTDATVVEGVPLRVAAVPGRAALTPFAIEAGSHALRFLAHYFDLPYPAHKIDHVAIPDFAFGAMENLGCVTYRETALLLDTATASQVELERVATVVAHETAHMWFGDLVTMKWWNGIWLNEAFATFMELTTTEAFRPEWHVWTGFGAGKAAALGIDGLRNTRPVEFEVGRPEEAEAMFDVLTYQKGGAVLRMLEQYLGPDTFRRGIAHYLASHLHANTETTDLWDAIEEVSGQPVRATMDSWIFQGGYPLMSVSAAGDGRSLTLGQHRFTYQGGPDAGERWVVPVNLRASVEGSIVRRRVLLEGDSATVELDGPLDWAVVNDGGWGFYRARYSPDLLDRLSADLGAICDPLERLGLLGDTWAAVVAGAAELGDWAGLVAALGDEDDPDVWGAVSGPASLLDLIATESNRLALQSFVRAVARPALERLGGRRTEGGGSTEGEAPTEEPRRRLLRSRLIAMLGTLGADTDIQAQAARDFAALQGDRGALDPDLVTATVNVVAASGGAPAWEALVELYRGATTPQDKVRFLFALGGSDDPASRLATLDLCLTPEVRSQDVPFVIAGILAGRGGAAAWEWLEQHWDEVLERIPSNLVIRLLEGITGLVEPAVAARVHAWLEAHPLPVAAIRVAQLRERLDINVALGQRVGPAMAVALGGAP
ncbi:MAG: M1 family metallopeptidase [Acidimicrobiales bacterium]